MQYDGHRSHLLLPRYDFFTVSEKLSFDIDLHVLTLNRDISTGSDWWLQSFSLFGFEMTYNWAMINFVILSGIFTSLTKYV